MDYPLTPEQVWALGERLSNWGRWGPDDELGTLNFITPEKIQQAASLVRRGVTFSLAIPFDANGPQWGRKGRHNPLHLMIASGADAAAGAQDDLPGGFRYADDSITMPLQCATQWDGLSHVFYHDKMYNGYDIRLVSGLGAAKNSIDKLARYVVTRGVLVDIPRLKGVDWLERGTPVTASDLDAALDRQRVQVGTGDALLVRTGRMALAKQEGWKDYAAGDAPGLGLDTAEWLRQREIAAVATDTWGVEVRPPQTVNCYSPFHMVAIRNMGLLLGEIFDLEELAADCARDGVYQFQFVSAPLPVTGAVGSPINPLAIK